MKYKLEEKLNEDQDQINAVLETENPCKIIAGPGSGKTRTMVAKYIHLVANKGIEPSKILFLTFGNKATEEMKDRVIQELHDIDHDYNVDELNISTIHGFCNHTINNNRSLLSRTYTPTVVLDEYAQTSFILSFIDRYGAQSKHGHVKKVHKEISQYFNKITDCNLSVDELGSFFNKKLEESNKIYHSDKKLAEDIAHGITKMIHNTTLYEVYIKKLAESGFTDFGNIQKFLYDELKQNKLFLEHLQDKYEYVLIDEYQDTSYIQSQIIFQISNPQLKITVCGDDDQSLYRWRGATPKNFLNFENEIKKFSNNTKKAEEYKLVTNYRSTEDIVSPSNKVIQNNTLRSDKKLHSANPTFGICSYVESDHEKMEPIYIAKTIRELKEKGHIEKYSDVAILFRSVGYKDKFVEALRKYNIPITRYGFDISKSSDVSYSIIKIIGFIAGKIEIEEMLSNDNGDEDNFFVKKSNTKYISFLKKLHEDYFNDKTLKVARKYDELKYRSNLAIFYEILTNNQVFKDLIEKERDETLKEIALLSQVCLKFDSSYRRTDLYLLHSMLNDLDIKGDIVDNTDDNDTVKLMTIHQSKGLEFPIVILPGLNEPKIKRTLSYKRNPTTLIYPLLQYESNNVELINDADERKIFYVGMTRAERGLILSRASNYTTRYGNEKTTTANKYLLESGLNPIEWDELVDEFEDKNIYIESEEMKYEEDLFISFSKIRTYMECPKKYRFLHDLKFATISFADISFGLTLHRCLDDINSGYLSDKKKDYNENELKNMIDRNWVEVAYRKGDTDKLKDNALTIIKKHLSKNKDRFNEIKYAEKPFQVTKDNYIMTGVIDLVREKDNKIELIDYKTREIHDAIYEIQMALYAFSYKSIDGDIPNKLTLHSLATGKEKNIPFDKKKFDKIEEKINSIVGNIRSKKYDTNHCNDCYWCKISK